MNPKLKIVVALWFFQATNYIDRIAITFAAPLIMSELSLNHQSFGLVLSAFGVGYTLAQIPGGILADRWSVKGLLVITPILWAVFTGFAGLAASVTGFVIARVLLGASEGLSNTAPFKVFGDHFAAKERTAAMAATSTARSIGVAIAGPLAGLLIASFGWRALFFAMVIPSLLAALLNSRFLPGRQRTPSQGTPTDAGPLHRPAAADYLAILRLPSFWILLATYVCFNVFYWGYTSWMPTYLSQAHHLDIKKTGAYASIPYLGTFVGLLLLGGWAGTMLHRYRPQLLAACYVLGGVSLFLAFASHELAGALTGLTCAALFINGTTPIFGAVLLEIAPTHSRALYIGVVMTTGQIGGVIAPALIGALVERSGSFGPGFALMEGAMVLAALGMVALRFVSPELSARHRGALPKPAH